MIKIISKILLCLLALLVIVGCLSAGADSRIYNNAKTVDVMSGSKTNVLGQVSVVKAKSADVTEEVLNDCVFNYVNKNDFMWCIIIYTD